MNLTPHVHQLETWHGTVWSGHDSDLAGKQAFQFTYGENKVLIADRGEPFEELRPRIEEAARQVVREHDEGTKREALVRAAMAELEAQAPTWSEWYEWPPERDYAIPVPEPVDVVDDLNRAVRPSRFLRLRARRRGPNEVGTIPPPPNHLVAEVEVTGRGALVVPADTIITAIEYAEK